MKLTVEKLTAAKLPERVKILTRSDNPGWGQGLISNGQGYRTVRFIFSQQQVHLITRGKSGKNCSFGSGTVVSV